MPQVIRWVCALGALVVLFSAQLRLEAATTLHRARLAGGIGWADVVLLPEGPALVYENGAAVVVETPARLVWQKAVPVPLLYISGTFCGGAVWVVGQGQDGQAYVVRQFETRAFTASFGQNATMAGCLNGRATAFVQFAPDSYVIADLDTFTSTRHAMPWTSQGFRDIGPDGAPRLGDAWFRLPNQYGLGRSIHQPVERGGAFAGQDSDGAGILVLLPDRAFTVIPGLGFEPQLERQDELLAIAARTPNGPTLAIVTPPYPPHEAGTAPLPSPPVPTPTPVPTPPQTCGEIPTAGQDALRRLWARPDVNALVRSPNDDDRRKSARMFAEQLAFTVDPAWGTKNAGGGRPQSKDAVARFVAGTLCGWDIVNGTTRELSFGRGEPLPGQEFMPVTPTDHLGAATPPPPPPSDVIGPLKARIAALEAELAAAQAAQQKADAHAAGLEAALAAALRTAQDTARENADLKTKLADPCALVNIQGPSAVRRWFNIRCEAK